MATGAKNIVVTGTDSTGTQTATYALTVLPLPTLTLNLASTSIKVMQGTSSTIALTAVTGGSFAGSISYSVSGLPPGVTAKWSANPATAPTSISTNSQILTLTASSAAVAASTTAVVRVAGDGLAASKYVTLQVQTAPGGVLLQVSPQAISMPSLSMATITVTATPVGGVALATGAAGSTISIASGLPKGFTASWGAVGVTSAGVSVRTLTLKGSSAAITSTSTLSLSGVFTAKTGSVYKAAANLPIAVTLNLVIRPHPRPSQPK
jgi:hypothetical protein